MRLLMHKIIDAPLTCLVIVLGLSALLVPQIPKLHIDTSARTIMLSDDFALDYYEDVKERFGSDDLTVVVIKADDVFTTPVLQSVERLSKQFEAIEEVIRVDSLTTINNIKGEGDSVSTGPLIKGVVPTGRDALERVRRDALANPILIDNVVAADARATAVLVYADATRDDTNFDARFSFQLDELIAAESTRSGLDIYQIGEPYIQRTLSESLVGDQTYIMPLAALVLVVVLGLMFGTTHAVAIPILTRVVSVVWAFGLMASLGFPITVLSILIPMLLVCIGFTEDVHLISEFYQEIPHASDKVEAIHATAEKLATPLLVTSLTTGVGFATLSLSEIMVIEQLGQFAPIAFASNLLVTLLMVPALLRYLPVPLSVRAPDRAEENVAPDRISRFLEGAARLTVTRRRWILAGSFVLVAIAAVGSPRIRVDNDIVGFFRSDSELLWRINDVHESLAGVSLFYLVVETGVDGAAATPETLETITKLQTFLQQTGRIDSTLSIADYIKQLNREMNGGDPAYDRIPNSAHLTSQYLLLLHPDDIEQYIDYGRAAANILVRHKQTSTKALDELIAELNEFVVTDLRLQMRFAAADKPSDPAGLVAANVGMPMIVTATGEGILMNRAADTLVVDMVTGLLSTITVVGIICSLLFMSIRAGLLSLVPNVLPIGFILGAMGLLDIPLNVGTAMIAAIAVGIAVDDTVHYMARNSRELDRQHDQILATFATLRSEGRAIISTSLALAGGFSVLAVSTFLPAAQFGVLSAVVMIVALVADLTITPVLMNATRLITLWNIVGLKFKGDIVDLAPLMHGLTRWEARKLVLMGRLVSFERDEYAVHRGSHETQTMYLVLTGSLRVSRSEDGHDRVLAQIVPGEVFGEMALVDSRERSADVIANEDVEVLVLTASDLERLRRRFPRTANKVIYNLAIILSSRLRQSADAVAAALARADRAA
jgi:predicted RND superfamily exporter protein/CRP-like cAMP-binding protein